MTRSRLRRLTLADLAILILGVAVALFLYRFSRATLDLSDGSYSVFSTAYKIGVWPQPAIICLAGVLVIARILAPRPRWRTAFRQPGIMAATMILAHLLVVVLRLSWHEKLQGVIGSPNGNLPYHPNFNMYLYTNRLAGSWVVVAWMTLMLTQAGRPEPSWIDRTGRILGIVAILQWVTSSLT